MLPTPPSEPVTSSPLQLGISATFFTNEDVAEEDGSGRYCRKVASTTLCIIPDRYMVPVDCPSIVTSLQSEAPANDPATPLHS